MSGGHEEAIAKNIPYRQTVTGKITALKIVVKVWGTARLVAWPGPVKDDVHLFIAGKRAICGAYEPHTGSKDMGDTGEIDCPNCKRMFVRRPYRGAPGS